MTSGKPKVSVTVDLGRCVGAGVCIAMAPKTFDIGPDQLTAVLEPPGDALSVLLRAEDECPMQAITVLVAGD